MTTVDILEEKLEGSGADAATYVWRDYTLRVVAGRPGSVCFTLLQEIPPAVWIIQAEGFTLDGTIHFTQRVLDDAEFERIIRSTVGSAGPAASPRIVGIDGASHQSTDLAADA